MKKQILFFIFLLFLYANICFVYGSDNFTQTIEGKNVDMAKCIQQTSDGGYIIAGYTNSKGAGKYDVYLVKINSKGNKIWDKTYGGKENDYGYFVAETKDHGFIITGSTESLVPPQRDAGPKYAYLIKTDSKGKEIWSRSFGNGTIDVGYSVLQKPDGGYVVAGLTGSYSMSIEMMIIETDDKGNYLEKNTKKYGSVSIHCAGKDGFDAGYSGQKTTDGNFIFAGETDPLNNGNRDIYLLKARIDFLAGKTDWIFEKSFGTKDIDFANSVKQTADLGYIIAGNTGKKVDEKDSFDFYIIKTDAGGNELWSKTYKTEGNEILQDVLPTTDNGYMLAGKTYSAGAGGSDIYLIKTDSNGKKIWSKTYGDKGYDGANSIRGTIDGGLVIAGYFWTGEENGTDIYIMKIDNPAKIKKETGTFSYNDFLEAGKKKDFARLMEYVSESITYTRYWYPGQKGPETSVMKKEDIATFFSMLASIPLKWRINEKDGKKCITCWDNYGIAYYFFFEKKGDTMILIKVEDYFPGL